jgi:hypothetical protein
MTTKKVRFIKFKNGGYSTIRIKRGFEKEFTLEKDGKEWIAYTKAKNGEWEALKTFKSAASGMKWLTKFMHEINMHDKVSLAKVLKKRVK